MTRYGMIALALFVFVPQSIAQKYAAWESDVRWTKTKWTASDTPYEGVAKSIKDRYGDQTNTTTLDFRLSILRSIKKPTPLEAFERLSLERLWIAKKKLPVASPTLAGSLENAHRYGDFSSYSMVRMRFLTQARHFYGKALAQLGERLLKKKPDDYDVERVQANLLRYEFSEDLAMQKRSLELAERVYKRNPEGVGPLGGYAEGTYYLWRVDRTRANAERALKFLSQYLAHPKAIPMIASSFRDYVKEIKAWQRREP